MTLHTECTLLEFIQVVSESARNDDEVVATVTYLVNSGRVRLCGTFAGTKIALRPSLKWMRINPSETIRHSSQNTCSSSPSALSAYLP